MKYKLSIRPRADIDRAVHFLYLSDRNPSAALRFDKAIQAAIKKIKADPGIGAKLTLPEAARLDMRFYRPKGFDRYLILFRVIADRIYISRILHGSQDIESAVLDS